MTYKLTTRRPATSPCACVVVQQGREVFSGRKLWAEIQYWLTTGGTVELCKPVRNHAGKLELRPVAIKCTGVSA